MHNTEKIIRRTTVFVALLMGLMNAQRASALETDLLLQNVTITTAESPAYYQAGNSITAGPNVTIQSGADATFEAGTLIRLTDGFTAADGSKFRAMIVATPTPNQAPTVDAGTDQLVTIPSSATLSGTVSDEGLPNPPGAVTTTWSMLSGPGTVTFGDATLLSTTADFSEGGTYVLQLTVNDGDLTNNDTVTITVNIAPTVFAGPNQTITLPDDAILSGTVTDDSLPNPPGVVTVTWSMLNGPGVVTFTDPNSLNTTASFSLNGIYFLKLVADDGAAIDTDYIRITVNQLPPVVDAGTDQTVIIPNSAALTGIVTDDGLPNPPGIVTTTWSMASGPGTVTFADASSLNTTADFSSSGVYVLDLTAYDGEFNSSDTVTITVLSSNTTTVTYEYDDLNQLKTSSEGSGVTTYDYDEVGNITNETKF